MKLLGKGHDTIHFFATETARNNFVLRSFIVDLLKLSGFLLEALSIIMCVSMVHKKGKKSYYWCTNI